jgi:hypothetical protein
MRLIWFWIEVLPVMEAAASLEINVQMLGRWIKE